MAQLDTIDRGDPCAEAWGAQVRSAHEFGWTVRVGGWTRAQLELVLSRAQPVIHAAALAGWFAAGYELDSARRACAAAYAAGFFPPKPPALRLIRGGAQ